MSSDQSRKRSAAERLSDSPSPPRTEQMSIRHTSGNNKIPRTAPNESPTFSRSPDHHSPTPGSTHVQPCSQESLGAPSNEVDDYSSPLYPSEEQSDAVPLEEATTTSSSASSDIGSWIVKFYLIHTTSSTAPTEFPKRSFHSAMAANSYARERFDRQMRYYDRGDSHSHESSGPKATETPLRLLGWSEDKHFSCYVYYDSVKSASEGNATGKSQSNDKMDVEEEAHSTGDERVTDGSEGPGDETSSIPTSLIDWAIGMQK
ncbi:MAG: hypothetical protein Q9183_005148 [Haloplaca sp. 2 TL-2023]